VNKYSDCTDSVTKSITIIPEPVIDFSVDKTTSCKAPFTVNFTDNSPDGNQWQWDFGDGILGTGKTVQHTYNREGVFNVTLNLQTSTGCKGSKTRAAMITITRPVVKIGNVPAGGCAPYNYSPLATITSVEPIQSYGWDFGDGGTATGAMPTYPYITTGKFTLKLTITTTGGCTETVTIPNAVKVGTKPVVDFTTTPPPSVPPALTCAADSIQFTNLAAPAEEFIWRFGDGSDTSMKKNPKHKFIAPGSIPVTLVAINNGCADSITKTIVNIKPPVAKFDYTVNCAASGGIKVDFVNQSIPDVGTTYLWQFGDPANSTNSNIGPVSFTYPSEDIYTAKLIVSSTNGCRPDTFTRKINLRTEKASFKITDSTVCRNQPFTLTATNTNPGKVKTYQWKIGNIITYANDTINKLDTLVSVRGIYPVELTIIDTNLCTSTLLIPNYLKVLSPRANFSAVNNGGCVNAPILFADSSVSTVPVKKWTFDFGDEQSQIFTAPPFRHTYSQTGIYNVRLIAEDAESCADTILKPFSVNITRPRANFGTEFTNFCANKNLQFVDSSSGGVNFTYLWDFGDGTTSNLPNPAHQYATRTTPYTVKLTITDQFGCSDVITRTNYITIATPKAAFDIKDTIAICPPLETKFTFKGTGYASFYWVLGNGTDTLDIKDPTFFYNDYGTFVAKLVVEGNGGCIDSATRNVYVYNPATSVNISYPPTKVCNEATINFTISTPPNTSFVFYYGDQGADSTQRKTLSRLYNFPGTYSPYVELRDIYGCTANVGGPTPIQILGSIPVFSASGKKFCDSAIVFFNNFSLDNDPPVSYLWNFGDGTTSTDFEPFYRYTTPGLYSVSLEATTKSSCVKVFTDTIRIFRTPQPIITSIDTICLNTPVFFEGSLAVPDTAIKWRWLLSDGRMDSVPKTVFGFKTPGAYTIQLAAKNSFGCADTSSKSFTIQPLPKITLPPTVSIGIGKSIEIPATYTGTIRSYTWMPTEKLSCSDCPKPIANPQFTTTYRIKVIDENSCSDVKDITIKVICDNSNFFIPNTFSPNTDGVNDRFYPRGNGIERIQSFRIFNRWGQLVYDKREFAINDSSVGWDGTQNGKPAAADTYVYMIDLICENAVIVNYKGNITLIR
jgi:gliding motility-associated-like protein